MLKSPHAVKLVATFFVFFSLFVVYSNFSGGLLYTDGDQRAQLVAGVIEPTTLEKNIKVTPVQNPDSAYTLKVAASNSAFSAPISVRVSSIVSAAEPKSSYFSNDTDAWSIAQGLKTITMPSSVHFSERDITWRIQNAYRMIGYEEAGMPVRKIIGKNEMIDLDAKLAVAEQKSKQKENSEFSFYEQHSGPNFKDNIPQSFMAYNLATVFDLFNAGPTKYQSYSYQCMFANLFPQMKGALVEMGNTNPMIVQAPEFFGFINRRDAILSDEYPDYSYFSTFSYVATLIHEFVHDLDTMFKNNQVLQAKHDRNSVCSPYFMDFGANGTPFIYNGQSGQQNQNDYISKYAAGLTNANQDYRSFEDAAESVAAYILLPDYFRAQSSKSNVLAQKYEYIKTRLFGGVEFYNKDITLTTSNETPDLVSNFVNQNHIQKFNMGNVTVYIPLPAPVLTSLSRTSATAGSEISVTGSGFSPTGNKVQLTTPNLARPPSTGNSANVLLATVTATSTPTTLTWEIADIPSADGTSLIFTIPSGIPTATYTLKVAASDGVWSDPISVRIVSRVEVGTNWITEGLYASDIGMFKYLAWTKTSQDSSIFLGRTNSHSVPAPSTKVGYTISGEDVINYHVTNFRFSSAAGATSFLSEYIADMGAVADRGAYRIADANFKGVIWRSGANLILLHVNLNGPQGNGFLDQAFSIYSEHFPPSTPTTSLPESNTPLIARLLALIKQLTEQLQAMREGNTPVVVVTPTPTPLPNVLPTITSCTQEVNQCSDGSFVGRIPPTCAFQACPTFTPPPQTLACPTDTSSCNNGTSVSRVPPLCMFAACPNNFTPPPPVVVTPPPPVVTPTITIPPVTTVPPVTTITPTPTPAEPSITASLSSTYDNKAGQWSTFAPGINSGGKANDFIWNTTLTLSSGKTIRSININHNASGEYWSTDNANAYPLVVFYNGTQLNTAYSQTLGTYGAGTTNLTIYGQFENPTFSGGTITITFTDNTSVTTTISASSFSPCTDCTGQAGAVFEALGDLISEWWEAVKGTFAK